MRHHPFNRPCRGHAQCVAIHPDAHQQAWRPTGPTRFALPCFAVFGKLFQIELPGQFPDHSRRMVHLDQKLVIQYLKTGLRAIDRFVLDLADQRLVATHPFSVNPVRTFCSLNVPDIFSQPRQRPVR